jgi:DNA repair protein RadC
MKIKEIPWYNRPGIRLKKKGVSSLSDSELLAVVLGRGNKDENAIDISNRILKANNFDKLSNLSFHELETEFKNQVPAMKIQAMFEIFRRTNKLKRKGFKVKIRTPADIHKYYADELEIKKKEHLYALFLDSSNYIIGEELISVGTLNASLVHPREVFKNAVKCSAHSLALVHNHPGGNVYPSKEDLEVTKQIRNAGRLLGINLKCHVIVTKDDYHNIEVI